MPVRWSAELDQILLLKLLETHEITLKPNLICNAWPKDKGEAPTERAIREHLFKLRKDHGVKGKFAKAPSTPVKRESSSVPYARETNTCPSSGSKRKRNEEAVGVITPFSMVSSPEEAREEPAANTVKNEAREEDAVDLTSEPESPNKRIRRSGAPSVTPASFSRFAPTPAAHYTYDGANEYLPGPVTEQDPYLSHSFFSGGFDDEYA